jgi:hypothetical protein
MGGNVSRLGNIFPDVAIKAPCRAATTANITLSGLQTIDGVALAAGDRVLVWQQTDQTLNGIYQVVDGGGWIRTADASKNTDFIAGTLVTVLHGAANGSQFFELTTVDSPVVFGVSLITWAPLFSVMVIQPQFSGTFLTFLDSHGHQLIAPVNLIGAAGASGSARYFISKAQAAGTTIDAAVQSAHIDNNVGDFIRVAAAPAHQGSFRSLDRFMPDGSTDPTNGGWWEVFGPEVRPQAFGVVNDGDTTATDNTTAWGYLAAYLQLLQTAGKLLPKVSVPAGVYVHAGTFSNFAFNHLTMVPDGEVTLRYTGTGADAVWLNGTAMTVAGWNGCWDLTWGNFRIEATASALCGLRVSLVHHSRVWAYPKGAGPASAGATFEGCVCTEIHPTISGNEVGDWYLGAKPLQGLLLDRTTGNNFTAYCTIVNPVCENTSYGIYFFHAIGNTVLGGTAEGCTHTGLFFDDASLENKAIGTDTETNTVQDVFLSGTRNRLLECDTDKLITIGANAVHAKVRGGAHGAIVINAGSVRADISDLDINRINDGSGFSDNGTGTRLRNIVDAGSGALVVDSATTPVGWVPVLAFGGASTGISYSSQSGTLYNDGKLAKAFFDIVLTSKGSAAGAATIAGLPIGAIVNGSFAVGYAEHLTITGAISGLLPVGTGVLSLMQSNGSGSTPLLDSNFSNTTRITGVIEFSVS